MAKKAKSYSYVAATEALKILSQRDTTAEELIYELLSIFAGFGDGQIGRLKDGRGNSANDGKTILVKNLVAYRPQPSDLIENLYKEIEVMVADNKISRHNPRLYIVSNGHDIVAFDPKSNEYDEFKLDLLWRDFDNLNFVFICKSHRK